MDIHVPVKLKTDTKVHTKMSKCHLVIKLNWVIFSQSANFVRHKDNWMITTYLI